MGICIAAGVTVVAGSPPVVGGVSGGSGVVVVAGTWLVASFPVWPTDAELRSPNPAVGPGPRFHYQGDGTHAAGFYSNDNVGSVAAIIPPTRETN